MHTGGKWYLTVICNCLSLMVSDAELTFHFHALEKEMATHSSALAWSIPGMGEPGGLPSMGSHRVGHDWSDSAAAAAAAASLHVLTGCLHACFGETSIQTLCPFFSEDFFFFWGDFFSFVLGVFCFYYWVVGANLISSYPWLCILVSWPLAWWWRLLTDLLVSTFVPFSLFSSHCPVQGDPVKT